MILERTVIKCKPGSANQMVNQFKEMGQRMGDQDVIKSFRILTDLTGPFDTVVIESVIESIDAYFAMLEAMYANQEAGETDMEDVYRSGYRTFYTIEASF